MTTTILVPDRTAPTRWETPPTAPHPGWWTSIRVDITDLEASIAAEAARLGIDLDQVGACEPGTEPDTDLWWAWYNADDLEEAAALLYNWGDQARVIVHLDGLG